MKIIISQLALVALISGMPSGNEREPVPIMDTPTIGNKLPPVILRCQILVNEDIVDAVKQTVDLKFTNISGQKLRITTGASDKIALTVNLTAESEKGHEPVNYTLAGSKKYGANAHTGYPGKYFTIILDKDEALNDQLQLKEIFTSLSVGNFEIKVTARDIYGQAISVPVKARFAVK